MDIKTGLDELKEVMNEIENTEICDYDIRAYDGSDDEDYRIMYVKLYGDYVIYKSDRYNKLLAKLMLEEGEKNALERNKLFSEIYKDKIKTGEIDPVYVTYHNNSSCSSENSSDDGYSKNGLYYKEEEVERLLDEQSPEYDEHGFEVVETTELCDEQNDDDEFTHSYKRPTQQPTEKDNGCDAMETYGRKTVWATH